MRGVIESLFARRRGLSSRLACLPALVIFEWMVISAADRREAIEGWLLTAICVVQAVRPTLLGWAVVLSWFAFETARAIEVSLRLGYHSWALPSLALVLGIFLVLLVLRPRIEVGERFAQALALLLGLVGTLPLFTVWSR
jgi:hypothetical protein